MAKTQDEQRQELEALFEHGGSCGWPVAYGWSPCWPPADEVLRYRGKPAPDNAPCWKHRAEAEARLAELHQSYLRRKAEPLEN